MVGRGRAVGLQQAGVICHGGRCAGLSGTRCLGEGSPVPWTSMACGFCGGRKFGGTLRRLDLTHVGPFGGWGEFGRWIGGFGDLCVDASGREFGEGA